ncbi:MAG: hypothetical protein LW630_07470 [Saprospiraceae bacterium]|nr:hypothetical protein [Saprospiraceae bacterium]
MENKSKSVLDSSIEVIKDQSLNQYDDKVLFPEILQQANETLQRIGIPKCQPVEKN